MDVTALIVSVLKDKKRRQIRHTRKVHLGEDMLTLTLKEMKNC